MHIISSMQRQANQVPPDDVIMMVSYTGEKLSTCFNVKDKTTLNHEHDIVFYAKYPEESCSHDYLGESGRRKNSRAKKKIVLVETLFTII